MIEIDHIGMPARDVEASAHFLCDALGLPDPEPEGPDREMFCVRICANSSLLYYPSRIASSHHVAFRVDAVRFADVVERLRKNSVLYGNDPEDFNQQTADVFGGRGRVYFRDPNGHVFEVMA